MSDLPARPDAEQLRRQAKELLRSAKAGDSRALDRVYVVSDRLVLASAQLAVAREYGFPSWAKLTGEVRRREVLNNRDVIALTALTAEDPSLATAELLHFCDHPDGAAPLNYIAMLRFDAQRLGLPHDLPGTGAITQALLDAGAPVNGQPFEDETPLMTAASYGDAEVARVLIAAGADIDALSGPDAGGVPNGSALRHAAVFGNTAVVDVLVAAGARISNIREAAAAGDITGWLTSDTSSEDRGRALIMAADHQRVDVVDQLIAAGTPVDGIDTRWGRHPLRHAAENGRPAGVRRLLDHGADPNLRDPETRRTPLECCRGDHRYPAEPGHREVEAILLPLTTPPPSHNR